MLLPVVEVVMRAKLALAIALSVILVNGTAAVSIADRPGIREITLPAGLRLPVVLDTSVASNTSRVEQAVSGHTTRDVLVNGVVVVPAGSQVLGAVTDARRSGRVKGRAHVAIRFSTLVPRNSAERYRITTSPFGRTAPATKKDDAVKIGAPAAGGAIIGAIAGGKKGALIGTGVGAGAGTAVVLTTRGKETGFARGTALAVRLLAPVTVKVRT
jgi:hypothetical protein